MLLSVIVSVFNLENFIAECLESLVRVPLSSEIYEIIVIDDGSTDGSLFIIEKYAKEYRQVKFFFQPNQGVGSSRNLGIRYAKGTYLWFVDGDDFIDSHKVKSCIEQAHTNNVDILAFDYSPVNERGDSDNWVTFKLNFPQTGVVTGPEFYFENYAKSYIWLYFFKREIFFKHKLTFEDSIRMQDGEIMPRIFMHSITVKCMEEKLVYYRFRNNSAVNDKSEDVRAHFYYSMVIVADRLRSLQLSINKDDLMHKSIGFKRAQLNQMLFTNFVCNTYSKPSNRYFISLLKKFELLPFQKITGFTPKMNLVYNLIRKVANINPVSGRMLYQKVLAKQFT